MSVEKWDFGQDIEHVSCTAAIYKVYKMETVVFSVYHRRLFVGIKSLTYVDNIPKHSKGLKDPPPMICPLTSTFLIL